MEIAYWKVLLGFTGEKAANEFVFRQGIEYGPEEKGIIIERIRDAREYVSRLGKREVNVSLKPIQEEFQSYLKEVESESTFKEQFLDCAEGGFKSIDPKELIVGVESLNVSYIDELLRTVPKPSDAEGTLKYCLPTRKSRPLQKVAVSFNPDTNTYNIVTDNLDFRIIGAVESQEQETGRQILGFVYGGGLPHISVAEYKGRYILKNGHHRAYALMKNGHTSIPVLVVRPESFAGTGALRTGLFTIDVIMGDTPPLLKDFATHAAVDVKRARLKMFITVHAESQAVAV